MLHQLLPSHGVRATLCGPSPPCNASRLAQHLDRYGDAQACVSVKYRDDAVNSLRRARGALVVLDNVDSTHGFESARLLAESDGASGYRGVDALLVQTRAHAAWLASLTKKGRSSSSSSSASRKATTTAPLGLRAIVLPHPHGNLNGWSVSRGVRARACRAWAC